MTQPVNNLPDRIWLCGFMGAGKSTIGRLLAGRLEVLFTDLDERIAAEAGMGIPEIFEKEGEEGFRSRERDCLMEVARTGSGVVALGGGSLQNQFLVDHLKQNGLLIFIDTPFSVILERISGESGRPLADAGGNRVDRDEDREKRRIRLNNLYESRRPLYEQADIRLSSGDAERPEQQVDQLITKIRLHVS